VTVTHPEQSVDELEGSLHSLSTSTSLADRNVSSSTSVRADVSPMPSIKQRKTIVQVVITKLSPRAERQHRAMRSESRDSGAFSETQADGRDTRSWNAPPLEGAARVDIIRNIGSQSTDARSGEAQPAHLPTGKSHKTSGGTTASSEAVAVAESGSTVVSNDALHQRAQGLEHVFPSSGGETPKPTAEDAVMRLASASVPDGVDTHPGAHNTADKPSATERVGSVVPGIPAPMPPPETPKRKRYIFEGVVITTPSPRRKKRSGMRVADGSRDTVADALARSFAANQAGLERLVSGRPSAAMAKRRMKEHQRKRAQKRGGDFESEVEPIHLEPLSEADIRERLGVRELKMSWGRRDRVAEDLEWRFAPRLRADLRHWTGGAVPDGPKMWSKAWRNLQTRPWGVPEKTKAADLRERLVGAFGRESFERGLGERKPRKVCSHDLG
jgi:hypothetical protein